MTMTRKQFLGAAAGGSVFLLLQACGGGGDSGDSSAGPAAAASAPGAAPAATQCGSSGASISGNHGHTLVIPVADLDSATDKSYSIQGAASHDHTVTFTPAQLQQLKAGKEVTVTSTTVSMHAHDVTVSCI